MRSIPIKCPKCGSKRQWKEQVNPVTSGIPVGNFVRIRLLSIKGLFAEPTKKPLAFTGFPTAATGATFRKNMNCPKNDTSIKE